MTAFQVALKSTCPVGSSAEMLGSHREASLLPRAELLMRLKPARRQDILITSDNYIFSLALNKNLEVLLASSLFSHDLHPNL